jgi:hypothetical protein
MEAPVINMIGDVVGELTGKIIGERIVRHHHGEVMFEKTLESKGKVFGVEVTLIATIKVRERPMGGMIAKGNGVLLTAKGEKVVLQGSAISIMGREHLSMRGIRYAQTSIPALARLNNVALVFEMEMMKDGTVQEKIWEWK